MRLNWWRTGSGAARGRLRLPISTGSAVVAAAGRAWRGSQERARRDARRRRARAAAQDPARAQRFLSETAVALEGHIVAASAATSDENQALAVQNITALLAATHGSRSDLARLREAFDHGRSADFDLSHDLGLVREITVRYSSPELRDHLYSSALGAAWHGGSVEPSQRVILDDVAQILGIERRKAARADSHMRRAHSLEATGEAATSEQRLAGARIVLGIEPFDSPGAIDERYRRRTEDLERLLRLGLPKEFRDEALRSLQQLREARTVIRHAGH